MFVKEKFRKLDMYSFRKFQISDSKLQVKTLFHFEIWTLEYGITHPPRGQPMEMRLTTWWMAIPAATERFKDPVGPDP